jgi:predicted regulator of Ras-like GTPase activity (Roadblock/LC7/MglB family)
MAIEGSLRDLSLANLIQLNCQEMNEVKILLTYLGKEGIIYCSRGNLVHAESGSLSGVEAVYELLSWKTGSFHVESSTPPAKPTIKQNYDRILMEAMQRIDEGELSMEEKLSKLAHDLSEMNTVSGAIIVARDGTVLADVVEANAEKEGAVAVFLGNAADQIGDTLALGAFDWGVTSLGQERMLVMETPDFFVGLQLTEKASPSMLASKVAEALAAFK